MQPDLDQTPAACGKAGIRNNGHPGGADQCRSATMSFSLSWLAFLPLMKSSMPNFS